MIKLSIVLFALTLAFVSPAYAHDEHEKGQHNHDHTALCKFISKTEADIPDLAKPNWEKIKTIASGFTYVFYHDLTRPGLAIAAMTVTGTDSSSNITLARLTWQVKDEMRSVRLEIDEMVCVKSIFGDDGKAYDLDGFLKQLLENGQKTNEPKTKI